MQQVSLLAEYLMTLAMLLRITIYFIIWCFNRSQEYISHRTPVGNMADTYGAVNAAKSRDRLQITDLHFLSDRFAKMPQGYSDLLAR